VGDEHRWLEIGPSPVFRITYTLQNDHPAIGRQEVSCAPTEKSFVEEFAPARTYGFLRDVGLMRKNGLARGGSLENAIVIGKRGPLNGLRFPDECVRHKILDLIGDLALLGRPVVGHVAGFNAGHALNLELVQAVQRALGLERRAVGLAAVVARPLRQSEVFAAPDLAAI
jgi:UDP-3-O-[3-hydroxymyristoyl] N-acetylglucosamine deacetylase